DATVAGLRMISRLKFGGHDFRADLDNQGDGLAGRYESSNVCVRPICERIGPYKEKVVVDDSVRESSGPLPAYPSYIGKSRSNHGPDGRPGAFGEVNDEHPDKSKLDWATEILAAVIRKVGENPDAPFTAEALRAAAFSRGARAHDLLALSAKSE